MYLPNSRFVVVRQLFVQQIAPDHQVLLASSWLKKKKQEIGCVVALSRDNQSYRGICYQISVAQLSVKVEDVIVLQNLVKTIWGI